MLELERRLASRTRDCSTTPDPLSLDVERARQQSKAQPLRSEGDFMTEARTPAAPPPVTPVAGGATTEWADSAAERLEVLREYERQAGLSRERREALRVLLRHDRELDLKNPWTD